MQTEPEIPDLLAWIREEMLDEGGRKIVTLEFDVIIFHWTELSMPMVTTLLHQGTWINLERECPELEYPRIRVWVREELWRIQGLVIKLEKLRDQILLEATRQTFGESAVVKREIPRPPPPSNLPNPSWPKHEPKKPSLWTRIKAELSK